jgi:hypothetical protein
MKGVTCGRGGAAARDGRVLEEHSVLAYGIDQSILRQGMIWRHSRRGRFCWQPAANDLRRVETGRWCDTAMQILRFQVDMTLSAYD